MSVRSKRRAPALAAALIGIATFVSACGGSGSSAGALTPGEDGLIDIRMAETPGLPAAFTQFGVAKGFFEEEGLDVEVSTLQGGQTQVSAALSGDVQFTGGDVVAFTTFRSRGVPVVAVRPGSGGGSDKAHDYQAIVAGGSIQTPKDLAGKTIAVNELNNVGAFFTMAALDRNYGIAPDSVKWAEIALTDVNAAIESGQIDAGYSLEPFQALAHGRGLRTVLTPAVEYGPNSQIGLVLTTEKFLASNPEAVAAFQRAHARTGEYITGHPDEFREALIELAGMNPEAARGIQLPAYFTQINRDTLTKVGADMVEYGLLDAAPDTSGFYAPGA